MDPVQREREIDVYLSKRWGGVASVRAPRRENIFFSFAYGAARKSSTQGECFTKTAPSGHAFHRFSSFAAAAVNTFEVAFSLEYPSIFFLSPSNACASSFLTGWAIVLPLSFYEPPASAFRPVRPPSAAHLSTRKCDQLAKVHHYSQAARTQARGRTCFCLASYPGLFLGSCERCKFCLTRMGQEVNFSRYYRGSLLGH